MAFMWSGRSRCEHSTNATSVCGMRPLTSLLMTLSLLSAAAPTGTASALDLAGPPSDQGDRAVLADIQRGRSARDAGRWSDAEAAFSADEKKKIHVAPVITGQQLSVVVHGVW
jgi:hypothetical protein